MKIDATSLHNWITLGVMVLVLGFVLHQIGNRVQLVNRAVTASFGA